ncbi:hypothetical protein CPC08DRAFT_767450 [Agrocybe pediades]|nr:hypothetical protein CPC08DRAFT_767450 [Agrocybe pediades]
MLSASQDQQNLFPSFPTNASTLPQSPNGQQLNIGLLNNLMQMQGLDTSTTPASSSLNMAAFDPQLLEQQIKLTQLQQLQQLQNQIFQQQIALISGQSSSSSPLVNPTRQAGGGGDQYTGLPTPGPSGEIRPQRPSMDFTPSSSLGNYMEPLPHPYLSAVSSSQNNHQSQDTNTNIPQHTRQGSNSRPMNPSLQRQLQALSNSQYPQYSTSQHHQHSASSPNFQPTSPLHSVPVSPMQHPLSSPNPFGGQQQHGHPVNGINSYSQGRFQTPHSAPESVAFHIYSEAMMPGGSGGSNIPGLTLGPAVDRGRGGSGGGGPILDQDISPLTSPWLGARPTGGSSAGSSLSKVSMSKSRNLGSKRTASSSGDEGGSARKKPSPAIRPTPTLAMTAVRRQAEERERDRPSNSPSDSVPLRNKSMTPPSSVAGKSSLQEENMVNSNNNHNPPMSSSASAGSAPGSGSVSPNPLSSDATRVGNNDMFGATMQPSSSSNNGGIEKRQRPYRGSKSTNSTPLLRSTIGGSSSSSSHARSKSTRATASAGGGAYGQSVQDSPSPVDLNVGYENESGRHDRSMMPPPPPPQSARLDGANGAEAGDENHESNANLEMELRGMGVSGMDMGMGMDMNMNMNMGLGMDFEGMMGVVDLNSHQEQHRLGVGGGGGGVSGVMNEEGMDMSGMDQMAGHMDMAMEVWMGWMGWG